MQNRQEKGQGPPLMPNEREEWWERYREGMVRCTFWKQPLKPIKDWLNRRRYLRQRRKERKALERKMYQSFE